MLDHLDDINWAGLKHAYGPARDVPGQIRGLRHRDPQKRGDALWHLYGNISHQGTRYEATPHAVPFLFELLDDPGTPDRHEIALLLAGLAIGYEDEYLPRGFDIAACRKSTASHNSGDSPAQRRSCSAYGVGPLNNLVCYDAVRRGVPILIRWLDAADTRLRCAACFALAWFPEDAPAVVPALRAAIARQADELTLGNALIALALLDRGGKLGLDLRDLRPLLDHASPIVRTAAAIALARPPLSPEIRRCLEDAGVQTWRRSHDETVLFREGNLAELAEMVIDDADGKLERWSR